VRHYTVFVTATDFEGRRSGYVAGMRQLIDTMERSLPDMEMHGIATRVGAVLQAQLPNLEAFASLDLSSKGDPDEILSVFLRAQHLPRMIVAFGKVLQEEGSTAWLPLRKRATQLAEELALVLQEWALSLPPPPAAD
jgi:hypothetical protein